MSMLATVLPIALMGVGVAAFAAGTRALRRHRLLRDTPTSTVRGLALGMAEVEGRVRAQGHVVAPFSGRECAWWEVEIQMPTHGRGALGRWQTVYREASGRPFVLADDTGEMLVHPHGAVVRAATEVGEETRGLGVPEPYAGFMADRQLGMRHVWAMGPLRFRERTLEEGRHVFVVGRAQAPSYATTLSMPEDAMLATGTDGAVGGTRTVAAFHDSPVIRRAKGDPMFLISGRRETDASTTLALEAAAGITGGPVLVLAGLAWLIEVTRHGLRP